MDEEKTRDVEPSEMDMIRQEAIDFADIGLYRYRFDGTVIFMDRGTIRIFELEQRFKDPANLVGRNIADLLVYTGPKGYLRALIREHGRVHDLEYPFRTLDGNDKWALHDSYIVRDESTKEESIQVIIQDITARKRTELALAEERERLAVTLGSIGDGVIATDASGRITNVNKVAEELTGWNQAEARGLPLEEVFRIIDEGSRQSCESPFQKVLATGKIASLANHTVLVSKDGRERLIADSGAPIRDASSRIVGVVIVFRDVTEKKRMDREMQRVEKLESIGVLAGGIAHDFNNILSAILGSLSLAELSVEPKDAVFPLLEHASKAALRARDLTQQLLTFAKGGAPIKKVTSIESIVRDSAGFALSGSSVHCDFLFDEALPAVEADAGQISQVIHNLVMNANQAMPGGGKIAIRCEPFVVEKGGAIPIAPGTYVRISVKDRGIGIPEEHISRIFDPYFTTKQKGSGLGLTIAHSIVKNHGGHIAVSSRLGRGTEFWFCLPTSEEAPVPDDAALVRTESRKGLALVMDDDAAVREIFVGMLRHLGFETAAASHGAEALEKIASAKEAEAPFDLVVLDLTVPGGMGGVETVRRLRQRGDAVKTVASSGYSSDPVMADPAAYGFTAAIPKPCSVVDLCRVLQGLERTGK